jgi:hypothetical protein
MHKDKGGPPCNWTGSSCSPPALEAKEPWCVRRLPWSPGPVQGAEMGKGGKGGTRANVTRAHQEMERGMEAVRRGSATVEKRRAQSIQATACSCAGQPLQAHCRTTTTRLVALRATEDWGQWVDQLVDSHSPRGPHGATKRGSVKKESTPEGSGLQRQRSSRSLAPEKKQPGAAAGPSLGLGPNPPVIRKRRRWPRRMPPQRRARSQQQGRIRRGEPSSQGVCLQAEKNTP